MYSWRVSEGRTWLLMRALGTIFKPQDVLDLCLFVGIRAKGGTPPETHREPIHGGSSANILLAKVSGGVPPSPRIVRDWSADLPGWKYPGETRPHPLTPFCSCLRI